MKEKIPFDEVFLKTEFLIQQLQKDIVNKKDKSEIYETTIKLTGLTCTSIIFAMTRWCLDYYNLKDFEDARKSTFRAILKFIEFTFKENYEVLFKDENN